MKLSSITLACLAVAVPTAVAQRCQSIPDSNCTAGPQEYGPYIYTQGCGRKVVSDQDAIQSQFFGISFQNCVQTCADDVECCAVNYRKCGGRCTFLQRPNGEGSCDALGYTFQRASKFNSAYLSANSGGSSDK